MNALVAMAATGGWGTVQTVVLMVLAGVTTITTALVGIQIGTVRTLRDSNNDLRARVVDLERERTEDKAAIVERDAENSLLRAMVTGKVDWVALTDLLEHHHREALDWWKKADERWATLPAEIRQVVTEAVMLAMEGP